jgi:hypothetical protein
MNRKRLSFHDWMKAMGMAFIVWGHVAAATTPTLSPPFNLKQLGVAFFVFLAGYGLARERRSSIQVVFNRYFEVFVWGLAGAIVWSVVMLFLKGDANLSNFLPLAGGLQLVDDAFPANPTTWYIGTYLHLLLLWAVLLRGIAIAPRTILLWLPFEIGIRSAAMLLFGLYVGYMQLANWIGVLLLGLCFGARGTEAPPRRALWPALAFVIGWPVLMSRFDWQLTFPWMSIAGQSPIANAIQVSILISLAYLLYTLAAFVLLAVLPAIKAVEFLSRNTLIVFIAHMPLYYLLDHLLSTRVPYWPRVSIEFVLCFVGLSFASEGLRRLTDLQPRRDRLFALLRPVPANGASS